MLSPDASRPDALAVVDVDPNVQRYGSVLYRLDMPNRGDEFHHFGWNACSSALSPLSGHPFLQRRYLIIPGIRSSRIYVVDTQPDPAKPTIAKIIEPEEVMRKTGYSRPHTIHCGPEGIYISTLGGAGADGTRRPPGVFIMDCETFDIRGQWEIERGPQKLHYDFWWNLPRDYMVSSEWGLPPQFENGIVAEDLLGNRYGHALHFWDLRGRKHVQTIDLGANHQMPLEVRPAHDPAREYGFVGVVVDTTNLEASIWTWYREGGRFHAKKTAVIPPEPADASVLPALLKGFGAVPPLISDIDLSLDDKYLYVACWGTGELKQYDVSDPMAPKRNRQRARRRHREACEASERQAVRRRSANDRDQPRRQARLLHQLALQPLGCAVLSRRRARRAGDVQRRRQRRHHARSEVLRRFRRRIRRAPDPARGRRLLDGFVLLPVRLTATRLTAR